MRVRNGFQITYDCPAPVPMLLMLSVHPSRREDLETADWVRTDPVVDVRQYLDGFGNICSRILAPAGRMVISADFVIRDSGLVDDYAPDAAQIAVHNLHHIHFDYQRARATKSALEVHQEQSGVCRDYAHLAITFCRCMNIPARYCTGYMGDIGVPVVGVMDFSAWMEVFLGGRWYVFDARNNRPRMARILIGRGRDASDVPIAHTFGEAVLSDFQVISEELSAAA